MGGGARWIDLLDPSRDELLAASPVDLHPRALDLLLGVDEHEPRPTLESHGAYVFGVLLIPAQTTDEDHLAVQEIDLVLTPEVALSVRKTPRGGEPFDLEAVEAVSEARPRGAM